MIPVAAISEALSLLPSGMDSPEARVMLIAIGLQESRFKYRRQLVGNPAKPIGPAKSFWQAEQGGGMIHGVRRHVATSRDAATLIAARGVQPNDRAAWESVENDDVLAAGLARLLLWSDPHRLPKLGDVEGAWKLYLRTWRPGKPHRSTWDALYAEALRAV